MDVRLAEIFNFNTFSSGRRAFSLRLVLYEAQKRRYHELVELITVALEHEEAVRDINRRWRDRDRATVSAEARPIDHLLNRTITAIRDTAAAQAEGARPGETIVETVERFIEAAYPGGVPAITKLPYINKLAAAEDLQGKFEGDLAAMVHELGLERLTRRLADLVVEYRQALENGTDVLRFDVVREMRDRGQNNLLEIAARIVGRYYKVDDEEHAAARAALLGPILEQQEAIRAYIRSRRAVRDIDPDTGELTGSDEPADELQGEAAPTGETAEETAARASATTEPAPASSPTPTA